MSNRTDRRDYREDLGVVLEAALVGAGLPATAFEDHLPIAAEFDGRSPFVCLTSAGSVPAPKATLLGKFYIHNYNIIVFVSREDTAADDSLDDCVTVILDTIEANGSTSNWDDLRQTELSISDATPQGWGGQPYWVETIPVSLRGVK